MNVAIGGTEIAAQALRRVHPDLAMGLHQFEKVLAVDKVQLAGRRGLGGRFVSHARNRRAQTQRRPGPALFRIRILPSRDVVERLTLAGANDEHSARSLSFDEQDRAGRQCALVADLIQRIENGLRKTRKKNAALRAGALLAVLDDFQPIGCYHVGLQSRLPLFPGYRIPNSRSTHSAQVTRTAEQGPGMRARVGIRTLRGRNQLPSRAGFLVVLPFGVTGKKIKRIDLVRLVLRDGLSEARR